MRVARTWVVALALVAAGCGSDISTPTPTPAPGSPRLPDASDPVPSPTFPEPPTSNPDSPAPAGHALGLVRIPVADRELELAIEGEAGIVLAWRGASRQELEAGPQIGDDDIWLTPLTDRQLMLGWIGTICDEAATLVVAPGLLTIDPEPRSGCDAQAIGRGVVLTFREPPNVTKISLELKPHVLLPEGG